jgi:hypothetical protein
MINTKKFRRTQTIVSLSIFVVIFFACWYNIKQNLRDIQLSYWGVDDKMGVFWNFCVVLLSISMAINTHYYISLNPRVFSQLKLIRGLFFLSFFSLFVTGVANMHYGLLHNIVAVFYFFSFPLAIFVLAHLNRKNLQYRDWCTHMVSSLTMVACPLLLIKAFHGMAMAEIVHSAIAIAWNIWISRKLTSA